MSCTFWNMRRRLKAQQQEKDKVITNLATAQAKEKAEAEAKPEKPAKQGKKAGAKNDSTTD